MRYVYCACCISYMLNDWSGLDKEKICKFILDCQSYDYAIAQVRNTETREFSSKTQIFANFNPPLVCSQLSVPFGFFMAVFLIN
jgi:hypothetical protein